MKRLVLVVAMLAFFCVSGSAWAADAQIYLDGKFLSSAAPEIKDGVTFVPLRVVAEELGANVNYFDESNTINIDNYDAKNVFATISLQIGQKQAETFEANRANINLQEWLLDAAPYLKNGSAMVPLRFIAEQMDCTVDYDNGRIAISRAGVNELDGQKIFTLHFTGNARDELVQQKDIIDRCVQLIKDCRGAEIAQPQNVATLNYQGYLYEFNDGEGKAVAAWQFYVPAAEAAETYGWSALYLYDVMLEKWYAADSAVYEEYFYGQGNLEPMLNSVNVQLP